MKLRRAQGRAGTLTIFGMTKAMNAIIKPIRTIGFFRYTVGSNFSRSSKYLSLVSGSSCRGYRITCHKGSRDI